MQFIQQFFLCAVMVVAQDALACPSGWTGQGGLCLSYHSDRKNWLDAGAVCADLSMHGHLVTAKDAAESQLVYNFKSSQSFSGFVWMGLLSEAGSWKWYDGKPVAWRPCMSDGSCAAPKPSYCGTLGDNGDWGDVHCKLSLAFICQYDVAAPEPTAPAQPPPPYRSGGWRLLTGSGQYSGPGSQTLSTLSSPSALNCVTLCQSKEPCDAISYHRLTATCQLMSTGGGISANQITASPGWETWVH